MRKPFFRAYLTRTGERVYCVIRHNGERLVTLDAVEAACFMTESEAAK